MPYWIMGAFIVACARALDRARACEPKLHRTLPFSQTLPQPLISLRFLENPMFPNPPKMG